jgi:diacylglycerol kinase family enzyme
VVLDTGTVNGEHVAVVAGAGLDALLVADAFEVDVAVDGERVFRSRATSVLVANTREAVGRLELSDASEPDDGVIEVGVITAEGPLQLLSTAARALLGSA